MIKRTSNFVEDVLLGRANVEDIDAYVEYWHTRDEVTKELSEFLGMTDEEYGVWCAAPSHIRKIIESRLGHLSIIRLGIPVPESVIELSHQHEGLKRYLLALGLGLSDWKDAEYMRVIGPTVNTAMMHTMDQILHLVRDRIKARAHMLE